MEHKVSLGSPGRVVRMSLSDTGNIAIEEFLNVGDLHHGQEVKNRGWYILWRDIRNAETMELGQFREE